MWLELHHIDMNEDGFECEYGRECWEVEAVWETSQWVSDTWTET